MAVWRVARAALHHFVAAEANRTEPLCISLTITVIGQLWRGQNWCVWECGTGLNNHPGRLFTSKVVKNRYFFTSLN